MAASHRLLLLFADGVGLGAEEPRNPFVGTATPALRVLLRGALTGQRLGELRGAAAVPMHLGGLDAVLGVAGLPQSGTGQTSLFTGTNAPALLGRHFGPWVHTTLRPLLAETNLLRRALDAGRTVAFANAYPAGYLVSPRMARRPAAPPLVARSASALTRDTTSLRQGDAVASSITNDSWREYVDPDAPLVGPEEAGRTLARIAGTAELTLFAHYDTDYVGHRGDLAAAVEVLERVDAFIGGVAAGMGPGTLLVIASDHGNVEDVTAGHTLNPTPVILLGPGSDRVARRVRALTDVAPAILELLGVRA